MIRTFIRVVAILAPIFVAASIGRGVKAGTFAQQHVSTGKIALFFAAVVLVSVVVLYATRKRNTSQQPAAPRYRRR